MHKLAVVLLLIVLVACTGSKNKASTTQVVDTAYQLTPENVRQEMQRSWRAYKSYAWGFDVLLPLSKKGFNWYDTSLGISPIDAYSTLAVMGLNNEAKEVEHYALSLDWNLDVSVQVFEVNIRILGGLLAIYDHTKNQKVLEKAIDFGNRLLPAFKTPTGLPYHSVNLKTGATSGDKGEGNGAVVNVAQAASYLVEFGILSYYAQDPKYYQTAKKATKAIFERKSTIGLPGDFINVETGKWTNNWSYLQAGVDSYYEYLLKAKVLFGDPELGAMWDFSYQKINEYLAEDYNDKRFYMCVNMYTGEVVKRSISLYDAFFPAVQALHGDLENAEKSMATWDWLWDKYGLLPTRYLYEKDSVEYANSELNPEIIESAYYLHRLTGNNRYRKMIEKYWKDINACCRNETAFHAVSDVQTMKAKDYLATYFYAETLKYFYLASASDDEFNFNDYIFNTEAHPFKKSHFDREKAKVYLGFE